MIKAISFCLVLVALNACNKAEFIERGEDLVDKARAQTGAKKASVNIGVGTVGVSNFRALYESYAVATGLQNDGTVRNVYQDKVTLFATDSDANKMGLAHTSAGQSLASIFCLRAFQTNSRARVYAGVNRDQDPADWSNEQIADLASNMFGIFLSRAPSSFEQETVVALINDLTAGNDPSLSNRDKSENVSVGTCTAVAASGEALWK